MGVLERIADIEAEMEKTQKNKATARHLGLLKAQLAKLRRELIEPKGSGGGGKGGSSKAGAADARGCSFIEFKIMNLYYLVFVNFDHSHFVFVNFV